MIRTLYLYNSREDFRPVTGWDTLNLFSQNEEIEFLAETINGNEIATFRLLQKITTGAVIDAAEINRVRCLLWLRDQPRFNVYIADQSRLSEGLLEVVYSEVYRFPEYLRPFVCIRFSDRYGGHRGVRDDIDYLNSLGFRLDCPSDFNELFQLLTMPQFIEAIGRASFDETIIAVDKFNRSFPDRPVWIL